MNFFTPCQNINQVYPFKQFRHVNFNRINIIIDFYFFTTLPFESYIFIESNALIFIGPTLIVLFAGLGNAES